VSSTKVEAERPFRRVPPPEQTPLTIRGAATVLDPPARPAPEISGLLEYQHDLLAQFGVEPADDQLAKGRNVTHTHLVDHLLAGISPAERGPEPDLVLVAYALPDVHPFITTASYLNWRLGSTAQSFAVSEAGLLAPFWALRIASAHHRMGRCRQLALAVLEQTTLPNRDPVTEGGLVDSGALLLIGAEPDEPRRPSNRRLAVGPVRTRVTPDDVRAELKRLALDHENVLLVIGPQVDVGEFQYADVWRAEAGSYCTSVWRAMADNHADWAFKHEAVVLYDVDRRTGSGATAAFRI